MSLEGREVFVGASRWVREASAELTHHGTNEVRRKIELVAEELVGMLNLDAVRFQGRGRKIGQVKGHNQN